MRILLTLIRKDCANFLRDKAAVSLTFLIPIMLIYIFGQVFGINRKDSGPTGIRLALINESGEPAAQKIVQALAAEKAFRLVTNGPAGQPLTTDLARAMMRDHQLRFAVVIPGDLIRRDGIGVHVKLLFNPRNDIEAQTVNGLLQKAIFSSAPELLGQSLQAGAKLLVGGERMARFNETLAANIANTFGGDPEAIVRRIQSGNFGLSQLSGPSDPGTGAYATAPASGGSLANLVRIENEQVIGTSVKSPDATRVVGGWAMMFLMFAVSSSAAAFFEEKKTGIFQRLLAAPVRRSHLIGSRFLYGTLLGLVQLTALFFAGCVIYGVDVLGNFGNLLVVCIAAGAASTSLGMMIVAFSPTPSAAQGLATFVVLLMSACGGAWFPVSFMPEFMQQLAQFTIVYWAMEGFARVLWMGQSFVQILPVVGVLAGIAAGLMTLAIWRFNRTRLFE